MDSHKGGGEDYVTIVSVGNSEREQDALQDSAGDVPFVTVLSIGHRPAEEEVIIYRLPGEKLGFGLKFEGGTKSSECVRRLFIQSCAQDSPAGRAKAAWGPLQPGDEILQIDCLSVTNLTRLECVRRLKDSNVAVSLLIRHDDAECALEAESKSSESSNISRSETDAPQLDKLDEDKISLPPPVPPRKLNKKNNAVSNDKVFDSKKNEVIKNIDTVTSDNTNSSKKGAVGKQSPGRPRRPIPTPGANTPPPEAQVYTDLFCQEKEQSVHVAESESDDTGSSISTVIDRLSVYSSFPGSVENSIPSTPTLGYKQINFNNVFNCLDSVGLISDIPPSIVEENVKVLSKTNNTTSTTLHEKGITVTDVNGMNKFTKTSEEVVSFTSSKEIYETTHDNAPESSYTPNIQSSDKNNNLSQSSKHTNGTDNQPPKTSTVTDPPTNDKTIKNLSMEPPKPKPRNINKKHSDGMFSGRQFDDSLSLTKLHCIESWLQDSISCKNSEDPAYMREDDTPLVRPEALPRLIDFVPKTQSTAKNSTDVVDCKEKIVTPAVKPRDSDASMDDTNHLRLIITRDPCQDWCNGGGSPQLETIYEDFSPCPILLIEESSRHPPAGDSGSDQGTLVSVELIKDSDLNTPKLSKDVSTLSKEDVSHKREDSSECGGVSRGPRPPPDGRENPLVHHEELPAPPPPLPTLPAGFPREVAKSIIQTSGKTNAANPKDTKRSDHYIRSLSDSPRRAIKTSDKSYGRGKDAKSEGSVKDKIAMFSVNKTAPAEPTVFVNTIDKKITNNRVTETVPDYSSVNRKYSLPTEPITKSYETKEWNTLPRKVEIIERTNSLGDYTQPSKPKEIEKKLSPIALLNMTLASTPVKTDTERNHKSTLDQLIEQRRKSMSKLRGLVIPDSQIVANLPEVKSRDSLKMSSLPRVDENRSPVTRPSESLRTTVSSTLPSLWDNQSIINNIPKYSPAFKRKPLQVYGPKSKSLDVPKYTNNVDLNLNKSIDSKGPTPVKPPRTSLDVKRPYDHREFNDKNRTLPPSFKAPPVPSPVGNFSPQISKPKSSDLLFSDAVDSPTFKSLKSFPETADSDDSSYLSTVSSPTPSLNTMDNTESDCSSHCTLSQKYEKHFSKNDNLFNYGMHHALYQPDSEKTEVCRSLSSDTSTSAGSNSSTLTSGSQASCSSAGSTDNGSHRVLKPRSIEAINRKNILASAKCRSGKDNKFGSPLIERKFSDVESTDDDVKQKRVDNQYPKPKSDVGLANSIINVAYSTVVEDKGPETDSTYSDTESDCDFGSVTLTKAELAQNKSKYTNGTSINNRKTNDACFNRRPSDTYPKAVVEQAKPKRVAENGVSKNNGKKLPQIITQVKCEESRPVFVDIKKCEYESYEASSCGVSEDEQDTRWSEVRLARGASGGVGVTLAGGADCEAKQVTIHKVLQGSAAERDGRLRKGDRVVSINGHSMKGVTHAQSVAILKEQLPEVCIVVCGKRIAGNPTPDAPANDSSSSDLVSVVLHKTDDTPGGVGLGISLQGGGNSPLLVNKLFTGGTAANNGSIVIGSELISAGGAKLAGLTRTQAWGLLRGLPSGPVTLVLRPP